jgi:hypothetical protein
MSVTINASTTSGLVMTSDLSGNLQFQNNGVNLPMGGVAPAFSAYQSSAQTLASGTYTKIQLQTEEFDTANCFDSTTNYRFTPTVAGYYQVNGALQLAITNTSILLIIYKNGASFKVGGVNSASGGTNVNALVYLNGTTDYIELYGYFTIGQNTNAGSQATYFQACLVRGA